jgi:hypothetical protein
MEETIVTPSLVRRTVNIAASMILEVSEQILWQPEAVQLLST